jgi:hypothetical protein
MATHNSNLLTKLNPKVFPQKLKAVEKNKKNEEN